MTANYNKSLYNQYEELVTLYEKQEKLIKENNKMIFSLTKTINELNELINNLKNDIKKKDEEILRLKSKNNRDSSNSNKPSGTNGYKKVITNRREKSNKKQGGQKGHKSHTLKNKYEQFLNSGNVETKIIEVNKNEKNKNKRFIEKKVIDIKLVKEVTIYRYYPNEDGKYNIPKCHNQYVQYGNTVKAICIDLLHHMYNSTDGVTRFISDITNGGMTISKGTLTLWNEEISNKLNSEIEKIENSLSDSYYINHDESQIKISGNGYNILCASNKQYTRLWVKKHKSRKALEEIGFLSNYHGIIVKDGTELYNGYGIHLSQCTSHILRYLKPYYTDIKHKAPKKMSDFLSTYNSIRNEYIEQRKKSFTDSEYKDIIYEYNEILDEWEKELKEDKNNYLSDDEYCLFRRMKYDNKNMDKNYRGDRDEILYFLKDFNVPSTNNQAETDQRPAKIKQKIGKFRCLNGAECYTIIRSCINTYKKKEINVLKALISAFSNNTIIA